MTRNLEMSFRQRVAKCLLPDEERTDAQFRSELQRLSVTGLRVVATVFVAGPLAWIAISGVLFVEALLAVGVRSAFAILALGLATLWLSYRPFSQSRARPLGLAVLYLGIVLDMLGTLEVPVLHAENAGFVTGCVTTGLLIAITAFPLKPLQTLTLGLALTASYVGMLFGVGALLQEAPASISLSFVLMISFVCAGLAAVVYHQRVNAYHARRRAEQALEELQKAHVRVMVSENAASQSRFAAALSHDLNSPLGALTSAFDTIVEAHRREQANVGDYQRLETAIHDAAEAGEKASERLRKTFDRMKQLTNLDRADEQIVDINSLWRDTVALLSGEFELKADVRLELKPVPGVRCRPQQISAVFSHLLRNAIQAIDEHGTIQISSDSTSDEIIIEVRDNGVGIPAERLAHLFEPSFRNQDDRVATTNWGLFITRSIVVEHQGQLEIESEEGRGTTARIRLPLSAGRGGRAQGEAELAGAIGNSA